MDSQRPDPMLLQDPSSHAARGHTGSRVAIAFAGEEERIVLRKVDRRILPFILVAYLFQQLDKSTLAYASVFGIADDANLVGKQLSWLGSILYLASLVAQPLTAMTLVKYPLGKVIAVSIFFWGVSLCMMSTCTTFSGLLFTRFVLGAFEAMIAPSCLAVTQMWWKKEEQTLRVSSWNAMNGIAPVIIFLACGLITIAFSIPVYLYLPDSPMQASFLTDREKSILTERLQSSPAKPEPKKWRWEQVAECFADLKTWCWVAMHMALAIPSGGISVFGSLIIKDFGFDKFQTILFNIPFGLIQLVAILGSAWFATKLSRKGPVIGFICLFPILGCILLLWIPHTSENRNLLLLAFLLMVMNSAITPLNLVWQAQNTTGETKKQCTTALMFVGLCLGNVIGPLLYDPDQAPLYQTGLESSLLMFSTVLCVSVVTVFYLKFLNSRRAGGSNAKGAYTPLVNQSESQYDLEDIEEANGSHDAEGRRDLSDITDRLNKSFQYVL